jgi:hypothetical protein
LSRQPTYTALRAAGFCFSGFPRGDAPRGNAAAHRQELRAGFARERPSKETAMNNSSSAARPSAPASPLCVACGTYHGSVGFELNCLRTALKAARAALAEQTTTRLSEAEQKPGCHPSR